jgi:hypothetical protein
LIQSKVEIVPFEPHLREYFHALNAAWLRKHFVIGPIDEQVLREPEQAVLEPGGAIFFARLGDVVIGTCELLREAPGVYELSKMGVDESFVAWVRAACCWMRRSPNSTGVAATACSSNPAAS